MRRPDPLAHEGTGPKIRHRQVADQPQRSATPVLTAWWSVVAAYAHLAERGLLSETVVEALGAILREAE